MSSQCDVLYSLFSSLFLCFSDSLYFFLSFIWRVFSSVKTPTSSVFTSGLFYLIYPFGVPVQMNRVLRPFTRLSKSFNLLEQEPLLPHYPSFSLKGSSSAADTTHGQGTGRTHLCLFPQNITMVRVPVCIIPLKARHLSLTINVFHTMKRTSKF